MLFASKICGIEHPRKVGRCVYAQKNQSRLMMLRKQFAPMQRHSIKQREGSSSFFRISLPRFLR